MANALVVKTKSMTWKGSAVAGTISASINTSCELIEDRTDGAAFEKEPGVSITTQTISVVFKYADKAMAITIPDKGALVVIGQDSKGGGDVTVTAAAARVESRTADFAGNITVTWRCYSTDGTTNPIIVT